MVTKANKTSEMDDWQVEQDLRTMIECEKIESDPKRMAKVRALAKKKLAPMAKAAGSTASELAGLAEAAENGED